MKVPFGTCFWDIVFRRQAEQDLPEETRSITVWTWYLDHERHRQCPREPAISLDKDWQFWHDDLKNLWRDNVMTETYSFTWFILNRREDPVNSTMPKSSSLNLPVWNGLHCWPLSLRCLRPLEDSSCPAHAHYKRPSDFRSTRSWTHEQCPQPMGDRRWSADCIWVIWASSLKCQLSAKVIGTQGAPVQKLEVSTQLARKLSRHDLDICSDWKILKPPPRYVHG